mgnify:CR=1 FL=1
MNQRCARLQCGPFVLRLIHRTDLQDRWNWFLAQHHGPGVYSISINRFVCHDAASPCDDRLADGTPARHDGVHYTPQASDAVAERIVAAAFRAAGLGAGPFQRALPVRGRV